MAREFSVLLDWCRQDRDLSQSIVDDIDRGARHYEGPVDGPREDVTAKWRVREAERVAYLDEFIAEVEAKYA
jgi:hypothetical protein